MLRFLRYTAVFSLLLAAVISLSFRPTTSADGPDMEWLIGEWYSPEMGSFERWYKDGKALVGEGYKVSGSDTTVWETMRITKENKGYVMSISLKDAEPLEYLLTSQGPGLLVFQNPVHDSPQRIEYKKGEDGAPIVTLTASATMDHAKRVLTFEKAAGQKALPDLPKQSMLGDRVMLSYGVTDLDGSTVFYESLGFKKKSAGEEPAPWIRMSDGAILLHLMVDENPWCGLTYVSGDADMRRDAMANMGLEFSRVNSSEKELVGVFATPDKSLGFALIKKNPDKYKQLPVRSTGELGTLGEIAIPVQDLGQAAAWFKRLGFKQLSINEMPYNWGIYSDGLVLIGLHETDNFEKPALTYFSMNAADHITRLQKAGLTVEDAMPEMKAKSMQYGVTKSPDGWPVNIFQGAL